MTLQAGARILVIDSAPSTRGEIAGRLGGLGFNVVVGDNEASLARLVEAFGPDLSVIEVVDGDPEAVRLAVSLIGRDRVIVTMAAGVPPERRMRAMQDGVLDVVIKPFLVDELIARMQVLLRRRATEQALTFDDVAVDEVGHLVYRKGNILDLTVTEFNLLAMFLRNAGRVISKRQLLSSVWGFDDYDVNLVEVHVSALRKKLEVHGERIIQTVRGIGYVLRAGQTSPSLLAS
jgi:two-component system OmpR family response regulator